MPVKEESSTTLHHTTWDEEENRYKCNYCCCNCCHIKVAGQVLAAICLIGSIALAIYGGYLYLSIRTYWSYLPKDTLAIIIVVCFVHPSFMGLSSCLVFVGVAKTKSRLIWPQIVAMILAAAITGGAFIDFLYHWIRVEELEDELIDRYHLGRWPSAIDQKYADVTKNRVLGVATLAIIAWGIQITFFTYFWKLKQFLADKETVMCGKPVQMK